MAVAYVKKIGSTDYSSLNQNPKNPPNISTISMLQLFLTSCNVMIFEHYFKIDVAANHATLPGFEAFVLEKGEPTLQSRR